MRIRIHQVDAFAAAPFSGNPAAVCTLTAPLSSELMQAVAAENNLSETAYLVPRGDPAEHGADSEWDLRWFTPACEVDLCGHATLASGHVVLSELCPAAERARFHTRSGALTVERAGDELAMDLPASPSTRSELDPALAAALGARAAEQWASNYSLLVFGTEAEVRALEPDMRALTRAEPNAVMCTAPGDDARVDFVSRFFAPAKGIDEDPVTGSAHTALVPYWSARLGRGELRARQLSARGGELRCEDRGERVRLFGRVWPYLSGTIEIPESL